MRFLICVFFLSCTFKLLAQKTNADDFQDTNLEFSNDTAILVFVDKYFIFENKMNEISLENYRYDKDVGFSKKKNANPHIPDYSYKFDLSFEDDPVFDSLMFFIDNISERFCQDSTEKIPKKAIPEILHRTFWRHKKTELIDASVYLTHHCDCEIQSKKDQIWSYQLMTLGFIKESFEKLPDENQAIAVFFSEDNIIYSRFLLNQAFKYYDSISDFEKVADINYQVGKLLLATGNQINVEKSLRHLKLALSYYKKTNDTFNISKSGVGLLKAINFLLKNGVSVDYEFTAQSMTFPFLYFTNSLTKLKQARKHAEISKVLELKTTFIDYATLLNSYIGSKYRPVYYSQLGVFFHIQNSPAIANKFYDLALNDARQDNYDYVNVVTNISDNGYYNIFDVIDSAYGKIVLNKDSLYYSRLLLSLARENMNWGEYVRAKQNIGALLPYLKKESSKKKSIRQYLLLDAYRLYSQVWQHLQDRDSIRYYEILMNDLENKIARENIDLLNYEQTFEDYSLGYVIKNKEDSLSRKTVELSTKIIVVDSLNQLLAQRFKQIEFMNDSLRKMAEFSEKNQNKIRDQLILLNNKSNEVKELDLRIARDKNYYSKKLSNYVLLIYGLIIAIAMICILAFVVYWIRTNLKNKQLLLEKDQLTGLARSKIHNIRSKYNSIYSLAMTEVGNKKTYESPFFSPIINYIDVNSRYLKNLLTVWGAKKWTIADELNLMHKFYDSEVNIRKPVKIEDPKENLMFDRIAFIQEVFTTLLDNSMRYAFNKKSGECIFSIKIKKQGNLLNFEISDNGEGAELEKYRKKNEVSGLSILDGRIANAFQLAGIKRRKSTELNIEASVEKGTAIKFSYPYEEVKNFNYRR